MLRPGLEEQHHLVLVLQLSLPLVDAAHRRKDVAASDQSFLDENAGKVCRFVWRRKRGEDEKRVGHVGDVPGREGACQSAGFPALGWPRDGTHPYYSRLFTAPKNERGNAND